MTSQIATTNVFITQISNRSVDPGQRQYLWSPCLVQCLVFWVFITLFCSCSTFSKSANVEQRMRCYSGQAGQPFTHQHLAKMCIMRHSDLWYFPFLSAISFLQMKKLVSLAFVLFSIITALPNSISLRTIPTNNKLERGKIVEFVNHVIFMQQVFEEHISQGSANY